MSSEKTEQTAKISESSSNMPSYLTEEEKKIDEDYEWCLKDPEVRRQYGGQVVVARQRRIWGAGKNHDAAWDAALQHPDCPHPRVCAFVVVPCLAPASQMTTTSEPFSSLPCYLTEEEKKMNEDYEWCLNDPEVLRQYGNQVVVAHQRRIWGAGKDFDAAWEDAQKHPDCPPSRMCVFVVVPCLAPASLDPSLTKA